jgi:hypothetical protein
MALGMGEINNASELIANAQSRSTIRFLTAGYSAQNTSQLQFIDSDAGKWSKPTKATVAGFSAICYLTAADVFDSRQGSVPMGLINTAVGGTAIQLWLPPMQTGECVEAGVHALFDQAPWTYSCWYNGMVSPLVSGPTDFSAFLWVCTPDNTLVLP